MAGLFCPVGSPGEEDGPRRHASSLLAAVGVRSQGSHAQATLRACILSVVKRNTQHPASSTSSTSASSTLGPSTHP